MSHNKDIRRIIRETLNETLKLVSIECLLEFNKRDIKYWSLYSHIGKFFSKAKNDLELNNLFDKAIDSSWPVDAVSYFYEWYSKEITA